MKRLGFIALFLATAVLSPAEEIDPKHELLIRTLAKEPDKHLDLIGDEALLEKSTSPASTIKVALAAIGLETKAIDLNTEIICSDRTPDPAPMKLREALDLSSNDFFEKLAEKIGAEKLYDHFKRWGYPPVIEKKDPPDYASMARGKVFSVSPQDQVFLMARLATRTLDGLSPTTYDQLEQVLSQKENPTLFGKTGSDREGSWFVAYRLVPEGPSVYVLRSDISNSDGKRLKRILIEKLERDGKPKPQN